MAVFSINKTLAEFLPVGVSQLGTIVYDNVVFPSGQYTDLAGNVQTYDEVVLNAVKIRINSAEKDIVYSKVQGQKGTNKEYIASDDIAFTITGLVSPDLYSAETIATFVAGQAVRSTTGIAGGVSLSAKAAPVDEMRKLALLNEVPEMVQIRNKFLQQVWGVSRCLITDMACVQTAADTWEFTMPCISDNGLDLETFLGLDQSIVDAATLALSLV